MIATAPAPAVERVKPKDVPGAKTAVRAPAAVRPGLAVLTGLGWAALLVAGAELGQLGLAAVFIPVAVIASVSVVRALYRHDTPSTATVGVAAGTAVVLPLAALGGPAAAVAVGLVLLVGSIAQLIVVSRRLGFALAVGCASLAPAVAAASVVAARGQGLSETLTLLAAVCLYDMANFLTGTGPRGGVIGALVGMITVGVLAVFVAAVMVPPFSGRSPWILLGLVAVLAPMGVALAGLIRPDRRLPALRRLDSLILAGPAWVIGVGLLLHR